MVLLTDSFVKSKLPSTLGALRKKAMAQLRRKGMRSPGDRTLLHESRVQQIELLMQNEELRFSQAELLESRVRYSQIYDFAPVGYFALDLRGSILESNLMGSELLAIEKPLLKNHPFSAFVSFAYRSVYDEFLRSVIDSDVARDCELGLIRRRDRIFVHLTGVLLTVSDSAQILIAVTDITRRRHAEQGLEKARQELEFRVQERTDQLNKSNQALQQKVIEASVFAEQLSQSKEQLESSNRQLRSLATQLMDAQDEERRRISRELHDDLSQKVASLAIETQQIQRDVTRGSDTTAALRALHQRMVHLAQDVHLIAYQLHPSVLDDLRLPLALQAFISEWAGQHKMTVKFTQSKLPDVIPNNVASCLYRVTQEGLRNVFRHAGTSEVAVHLAVSKNGLLLSIKDRGAGLPPSNGGRKHRGLGILSMRERLRLVNGTLSIRSRAGKGTVVVARIPISQSNTEVI